MNVTDYTFFHKLTKLFFIEKIWIYGSRARGDHRDRSDIDLAIECPEASSSDWHDVLDILENADTLLKIDCVRFDALKDESRFKQDLSIDAVLLFQRGGILCEDAKPLLQREEGFVREPRWNRHLPDFGKALERLKEVLEMPLDEHRLVMDAAIQRFEFNIELGWKTFKDFLEHEEKQVISPRDSVSQAYQSGWINNEKLWLKMLGDRNILSHDYCKVTAEEIYERIKTYYPAMKTAYEKLKEMNEGRIHD